MIAWSYSDTKLCGLLPELAQDANKYTRGKVSLVAGCSRYPGAAALAALVGTLATTYHSTLLLLYSGAGSEPSSAASSERCSRRTLSTKRDISLA